MQNNITEDMLIMQARCMIPGQCLKISRDVFQNAFPRNMYEGLFNIAPPEDRFLEQLPGTNYGAYKLHHDIITGDYTLSKHECGKERVREDWDRRNK